MNYVRDMAESKKCALKALKKLGGESSYAQIKTQMGEIAPKRSFNEYVYNIMPQLQEAGYVSRKGTKSNTVWKLK